RAAHPTPPHSAQRARPDHHGVWLVSGKPLCRVGRGRAGVRHQRTRLATHPIGPGARFCGRPSRVADPRRSVHRRQYSGGRSLSRFGSTNPTRERRVSALSASFRRWRPETLSRRRGGGWLWKVACVWLLLVVAVAVAAPLVAPHSPNASDLE